MFCEQIKKANVDHFESSQTIPKCELLVRQIHRDKPLDCLEHEIELKGAKGCSYFTLYIPDEGERFSWTSIYSYEPKSNRDNLEDVLRTIVLLSLSRVCPCCMSCEVFPDYTMATEGPHDNGIAVVTVQ